MQRKAVIHHISDPQAPGPLHMPSAPNAGFSSCLSPCAKTTCTLGGTPQLPLPHPSPSAWWLPHPTPRTKNQPRHRACAHGNTMECLWILKPVEFPNIPELT